LKEVSNFHYNHRRLGFHDLLRTMISGAHVIVYTKDVEADRAFFRDVLGFDSVDAGHGWLVFRLPPAEAALHPSDKNGPHELYFMCHDLKSEMAALIRKGVTCSAVKEERWGSITRIRLASGAEMGLYQPKHPTALSLDTKKKPQANKRRAK
jgi:catechol 2,3-dioxygenase-like lactoylglutathione lyase family enzyme